jgi:DNA invertase Pin-like site-specific DNA recombinase
MDKCWAFYRRSTDKQELSISDQRRECQALAKRMGLEIVREFEPVKGWGSGLTIDKDPSFLEMVRLSEKRGHSVRYLLVYDVSRFGRMAPEKKIYWEQHFLRQGITVRYAKDDFRHDGSLGDGLSQYVKHSEANQFSLKLSELTLRGAKSHAALGHSTGGNAPFGFDRLLIDQDGNAVKVLKRGEWKADKRQRVVWIPSPVEAPILQWVFDS